MNFPNTFLTSNEFRIDIGEVTKIVEAIEKLALMGKAPAIAANPGNITGWQELSFIIKLKGQEKAYALALQYAGVHGKDAYVLEALVQSIFDVARVKNQTKLLYIGTT